MSLIAPFKDAVCVLRIDVYMLFDTCFSVCLDTGSESDRLLPAVPRHFEMTNSSHSYMRSMGALAPSGPVLSGTRRTTRDVYL